MFNKQNFILKNYVALLLSHSRLSPLPLDQATWFMRTLPNNILKNKSDRRCGRISKKLPHNIFFIENILAYKCFQNECIKFGNIWKKDSRKMCNFSARVLLCVFTVPNTYTYEFYFY